MRLRWHQIIREVNGVEPEVVHPGGVSEGAYRSNQAWQKLTVSCSSPPVSSIATTKDVNTGQVISIEYTQHPRIVVWNA